MKKLLTLSCFLSICNTLFIMVTGIFFFEKESFGMEQEEHLSDPTSHKSDSLRSFCPSLDKGPPPKASKQLDPQIFGPFAEKENFDRVASSLEITQKVARKSFSSPSKLATFIQDLRRKSKESQKRLSFNVGEIFFIPQGFCGIIHNIEHGDRYIGTVGVATCMVLCFWHSENKTGAIAHLDSTHLNNKDRLLENITKILEALSIKSKGHENFKAILIPGGIAYRDKEVHYRNLKDTVEELLGSHHAFELIEDHLTLKQESDIYLDILTGEIGIWMASSEASFGDHEETNKKFKNVKSNKMIESKIFIKFKE